MPFAPRRAAVPAFASLGRMMDGRMRATGRPALPYARQHHEEAASVLCRKHSSTLRQVLEYPAESTMQNTPQGRAPLSGVYRKALPTPKTLKLETPGDGRFRLRPEHGIADTVQE